MHAWDVSPKEAVAIQKSLLDRVILQDDFAEIRTVAGVDVGFEDDNTVTRAAITVLDVETLELIQEPDGSPTEDFVIPEWLEERQKQQRAAQAAE